MKKTLFIFSLMMPASVTFSQGGYLPNSGFENWTTTNIYSYPDQWGSSNFADGNSIITVTQSGNAQHLSSSVRIKNETFNNGFGLDTTFGYVYLGTIGQSGPDGGFPYSTPVDQITGYYNGTIGVNDTAIVLVIKFMSGNMVSMDLGKIYTSQVGWTQFTFNLTAVPQDSIFVGLLSSDPFIYPSHMSPLTTIEYDNISLSHSVNGAGPALPNFSFETWSDMQSETPDGWTTLNDLTVGYGFQPVTKSTSMNSGLYAAKIETTEINTDTIPGMLIYGDLVIGQQPTPYPYNASPATLDGFYKYVPAGSDNAFVSFEFYNSGVVVGGNSVALTPAASYTSFSVPTNIASAPDSAIVVFYSGDNTGSALWVDDVQFTGGDVGVNEIMASEFSVYPNPTSDFVRISNLRETNHKISVFDNNGKLVYSGAGNGNRAEIDMRNLPNGFYTIQIDSNGRIVSSRVAVLK